MRIGGLARLGAPLRPTFRYWMETEVHVYAFSVAANALLSFFPFLIVMLSLCRYVFHWPAAEQAINLALRDYFPGRLGEFVQNNLSYTVSSRGPFQIGSVVLLLFTANGVFEPLEVALNRVWGVKENRTFVKNQLVSLGLIFLCGTLALLSTLLTALNQQIWQEIAGPAASSMKSVMGVTFFKMAAVPVSMLILFFIYWLLPNRRIAPVSIVPVAVMVGLALEVLKYVNLFTWPLLRAKLEREYGPFVYSVSIILWSFVGAMVVLAGAEWSARNGAGKAAGQPLDAELQSPGKVDRLLA